MRFIMPIILIGISVTVFFAFTNPIYGDISKLRAQAESYNAALSNSKELENQRDNLTVKKNAISTEDLNKLQKLLPENIDNIRLILEIEQIALPYGMVLKNVKYSTTDEKEKDTGSPVVGSIQGVGAAQSSPKDYGIWDLEFSTAGTYSNFLNFTRDLEKNLRIVDISSIQFSSAATGGSSSATGGSGSSSSSSTTPSSESYKYDFKIKTYWLKN